MRKSIVTAYKLTIEALYKDVSNMGDKNVSMRQTKALRGTVMDRGEAIKAVNDYFDEVEK